MFNSPTAILVYMYIYLKLDMKTKRDMERGRERERESHISKGLPFPKHHISLPVSLLAIGDSMN